MNRLLTSVVFILITCANARADYNVLSRMEWWSDAHFGMFIHFGSYSHLGHGEWAFSEEHWNKTNYQTQVSAHFNPTNFNAKTIASAAKAAGMKYLVITAKHHEGFAMWHSQVPGFSDVTGSKPYNLYDYAGFHRDVLKELKDACDAQGIKFCLYYSILDWNHPSQTISTKEPVFSTMASFDARSNYINDMKAQLRELVTRYKPAVLWFDGDWCANPKSPTLANWWTYSDATNLYSYLRSLKSDLIINERVKRGLGLGDFECPEQEVPPAALSRSWETCATMNGAWGYRSWSENGYRSASSVLHELVQVASRDGNYLLNIGPIGDGSMTSGSTNLLGQLAPWMAVHGESIHGTTRSPFGSEEPAWGYYTKRSGKLYAHVFNWPSDGRLKIPALANRIKRAYLLNDRKTPLKFSSDASGISLALPSVVPNVLDSVVVLEVKGTPTATVPPLVIRNVQGSATASANAKWENAEKAFDGSLNSKWFNGSGHTGWLQYQFADKTAWVITQYRIASAGDAPERDPKSWQLLGSANGTDWITVDSQTDQSFAARRQFKTYLLTNTVPFAYYRLSIATNNGADGIQLSEVQLLAPERD